MLSENDKTEILDSIEDIFTNIKEQLAAKEKEHLFDLYASKLLPAIAKQYQIEGNTGNWNWEDLAIEKTLYMVQIMMIERQKYV